MNLLERKSLYGTERYICVYGVCYVDILYRIHWIRYNTHIKITQHSKQF